MQQDASTNTWIGGMDQDTSKLKFQPNKYYELRNAHVITQGGMSTGAIENEKGTTLLLTLPDIPDSVSLGLVNTIFPDQTNIKIIGWTNYRDDLIVITTNSDGSVDSTGHIWLIPFDIATGQPIESIDITKHLKYAGNLNLNINNRIKKIIARYEFGDNNSGGLYKIYWTDSKNEVRHLNLFDKSNYATGTIIVDLAPESLGIIPFIGEWSSPTFSKVISGGQLKAGMIQYAYQLYTKYGAETRFSPCTNLIHLTASSEYNSDSSDYYGSVKDTNTGKSVEIILPAINTNLFDNVRVVSIFYDEYSGTPIITSIYDSSALNSPVTIIDSGSVNLFEYTLAEFTTMGGTPFICNDLEVKNNRLIAGGITTFNSFDVTWDSRAYRFNSSKVANLYTSSEVLDYSIDGTNPNWNVPTNVDCLNLFNIIAQGRDANTTYEYMYQADGVTLGGEGPNIKYEFVADETLKLDLGGETDGDFESIRQLRANVAGTASNPSYTNYASPNNHSTLLGYMRDEIYPFAVVWQDDYGRDSFASWIADIRFPRIYDVDRRISPITEIYVVFSNFINSTLLTMDTYRVGIGYLTFNSDTYYSGPGTDVTMVTEIKNKINAGTGTHGFSAVNIGLLLIVRAAFDFSIPVEEITGATGNVSVSKTINQPYTYRSNFSPVRDHDATPLGIKFTIKNFPQGVTGYRIVRCERTNSDRTNEMQGILNFSYLAESENQYYPYDSLYSIEDQYSKISTIDDIIGINSPEAAFFKTDFNKIAGDFITLPAIVNAGAYKYYEAKLVNNADARNRVKKFTSIYTYTTVSSTAPKSNTHLVNESKIFGIGESNVPATDMDGYQYKNYIINDKPGYRGTNLVVKTNTSLPIDNATNGCYVVNYKRNIIPYKGNSYTARSQRTYIPCTDIIPISSSSVTVYSGDTFISYFAFMYEMFEGIGKDSREQWIAVPLETRINLDIRNDKITTWYKNSNAVATLPQAWNLQESREFGLQKFPDTYPVGVEDLYTYNSVYSKQNNTNKFFPKPLNFEEITKFGTRIWASEKRISGSTSDQWLKFLPNVYKDVDAPFGDITGLKVFKDQLVYFQPSGFGIQPIDERIQTNDETGSVLVLGDGDILGRHGYISRITGCSNQSSVIATEDQLHFFDIRLKRWNVFTGGTQPLSDVKGMHSYFTNTLSSYYSAMKVDGLTKTIPYGIHGVFDIKNNRILMTFLGGDYNTTLSFNLFQNAFGEFLDYTPSIYIPIGNTMLALSNNGSYRNRVYKHGEGTYGTYYENTTPYPVVIKWIVNKYPNNEKIFTAMEYNAVVELNGQEYFDTLNNPETLTLLRMVNDHQTTGFKQLMIYETPGSGSSSNDKLDVRRRGRTWRFFVPRALPINSSDRDDIRIRSQYSLIEFRYNNNNNKRLILHDVTTHFTVV